MGEVSADGKIPVHSHGAQGWPCDKTTTDAEKSAIELGEGPTRVTNTQDLAWALMNSPAFLYNR